MGPERKILAVVKSDAYGHGLVPISQALLHEGVDMLGITQLDEGIDLRGEGFNIPILLMAGFLEDQLKDISHYRLTPVLHHLGVLPALKRFVRGTQKPLGIHLKVETGMGRLGLSPGEIKGFIEGLKEEDGISIEGIMTHFAEAEAEGGAYLNEQNERFLDLVNSLNAHYPNLLCHAANSAAILTSPLTHYQMVRPGIMLYGYLPAPMSGLDHGLSPLMNLKTKIIHLKRVKTNTPIGYGRTWKAKGESLIATLPIGYGDGYPRLLSNRGSVLMRGKCLPIVGRICMDLTMVDVTQIDQPILEEEVILMGEDGEERITADDVAGWAETISYEVLCGMSRRIPRIYKTD